MRYTRCIATDDRRVARNVSGRYGETTRTQTGERDIKLNIISGVVAVALALSTAAAFAQTQTPQTQTATQPYVGGYQAAPGSYYGGTGSSQKSPTSQYDQGNAQSLMPSPAQAAVENIGNGGKTGQKSNN
jgi:hypothetical protein